MRQLLCVVILALCASVAFAQDSLPIQLFGCELKEGKTVDNVMALADAYRTAWPSMNNQDAGSGAFVWTLFRGASPYDYIVGFINTSLGDMVTGLQGYYESGLGQGLDAQFTETGDCISAIVFSEQIRNGTIGQSADDQPDAVVESHACNFVDGADIEDIIKAEDYWRDQVADLNSSATNQIEAYRWTPYRGGTGEVDFIWVGNYPDMGTWAQGEEDYMGSRQGQAADQRFQKVSRCVSNVWLGYWIVPPAEGPTAE